MGSRRRGFGGAEARERDVEGAEAAKETGIAQALLRRAAGASAINLVLQLGSTGLGLITSLVLSRMLGASGLGVYAFAFALTTVLSVVSRLGLESLLVREVAVAEREERWSSIRGMLRFAESVAAVTAVTVGTLTWLAISATSDAQTTAAVGWAVVLLLVMTNLQLRNAALRGLDAVIAAQIPVLAVRPMAFLLLLGGAWALAAGAGTPALAMQAHAAAYALAWLVSLAMWRRYRPAPVATARPAYAVRTWMHTALPLLALGGLNIINSQADVLMLKWLASDAATGIYSVIHKLAAFTTLVLAGVNGVVASRFAALHAAGNKADLQYLVTGSAAGITVATLPIAGALLALGPWILDLYGPEFTAGYPALVLMVGAQIVNALAGSVGLLLVMSGNERVVGWVSTGTALLNIVLNALLIPRFGLLGAAAASASVTVVWNVTLVFRVRAVLGIQSTAIGFILRWVTGRLRQA